MTDQLSANKAKPKAYINRKTILSESRKTPAPRSNKIVFIADSQGHTFMELKHQSQTLFNIKAILQMVQHINLACHKLWSAEQQFSNRKKIFQTISIVIRIIIGIVLVAMLWMFVDEDKGMIRHPNTIYYSQTAVLLYILLIIWVITIYLVIYIFIKKYKDFDLDNKSIGIINEILSMYNEGIFKDLGYQAKCDEWATWISITKQRGIQSSMGMVISESEISITSSVTGNNLIK